MHVAITGAGGLVGAELTPLLASAGVRVTCLVRGQAREGEVSWDPHAASFDASALEGVQGVVHLAGENIAAARWTEAQKERIRSSRVDGTRVLCRALASMRSPPDVLVCASAIGFYGDRGDELLDETSPPGEGFLPQVVRDWEAAAQAARDAGIRVVSLRFGMILSTKGGALAKMLAPFRLGGGGVLGGGRQYWGWIALDDAAAVIRHALMTPTLSGPVNAVAPDLTTNAAFTKTLGRVLARPTIFAIPAFAVRLVFGQVGDELLLASARVQPKKLLESNYPFRHARLEEAFRHLLKKTARLQ